MHKPNARYVPVTLEGLTEKLDFETKRLVREREENIIKHVSTHAVLNGISTMVFKNKAGAKVTLSYQLDKSGTLRFAREKQFTNNLLSSVKQRSNAAQIGRASGDIVG